MLHLRVLSLPKNHNHIYLQMHTPCQRSTSTLDDMHTYIQNLENFHHFIVGGQMHKNLSHKIILTQIIN